MTLLTAEGLNKSFGKTRALDGAGISIREGEVVAIMGPSGSGKSTLLHCLAGILPPDSGTVTYRDRELTSLSDSARSELRRTEFGFVFQFGQLVPELTCLENVALPLRLSGTKRKVAERAAERLAGPAGGRRRRRPAARRDLRWPGPTRRRRPRAGHVAEGDLRRRTDRCARLAQRRDG